MPVRRLERLRKLLDEALRAGKRRKEKKKPGRMSGDAYGEHRRRQEPDAGCPGS
ncbi:hypothetical protein Mal64_19090 [Pseudobythopirellula maris]|uniref:Uncharacterized protein n=1 Tax=Pseudobythopirellula maris TaxID=2527991 RepID=A0A5C5ZMP3_9BACT|nr:hypothetical protein [Pseudobythopirellula maris]TWT88428.1 hypothetical protein Mal64_19090 [Pseudobythopirellula maris]